MTLGAFLFNGFGFNSLGVGLVGPAAPAFGRFRGVTLPRDDSPWGVDAGGGRTLSGVYSGATLSRDDSPWGVDPRHNRTLN